MHLLNKKRYKTASHYSWPWDCISRYFKDKLNMVTTKANSSKQRADKTYLKSGNNFSTLPLLHATLYPHKNNLIPAYSFHNNDHG